MKILLITSSGIGNAVMLFPLIKNLARNLTNRISILNLSPFLNKSFIEFIGLPIYNIIDLKRFHLFIYLIQNLKRYDLTFLDLSSSSLKNISISLLLSKKVIAMRKKKIPFLPYQHIRATSKTHNLLLNLLLSEQHVKPSYKLEELYGKVQVKKPEDLNHQEWQESAYFFIQLSSGNLKTPFKNWPSSHWKKFLRSVQLKWPEISLVFIGDKNEINYSEEIISSLSGSVINLVGKTSLNEAAYLLQKSQCYIGLDSGWMHLAAAMKIPTFTIFGASSYSFVGYEQFDPLRHRVLYPELDCWPCHAMVGNNTLRVMNPSNCPDHKCLFQIKPNIAFDAFCVFIENTGILQLL